MLDKVKLVTQVKQSLQKLARNESQHSTLSLGEKRSDGFHRKSMSPQSYSQYKTINYEERIVAWRKQQEEMHKKIELQGLQFLKNELQRKDIEKKLEGSLNDAAKRKALGMIKKQKELKEKHKKVNEVLEKKKEKLWVAEEQQIRAIEEAAGQSIEEYDQLFLHLQLTDGPVVCLDSVIN